MSESDSDDDNSLASVPRSSTGGSPPNGSNTALKKNNSTRRLVCEHGVLGELVHFRLQDKRCRAQQRCVSATLVCCTVYLS